MNDPVWVAGLDRARATQKYEFEAIHVIALLRNEDGVAPVVLQTSTEYLRSPPYMEAAFELCLRHLHKVDVPRPKDRNLTLQALLADRARAALKLPGRYIPTAEGTVIDAAPQSPHKEEAAASPMPPENAACLSDSPPENTERPLESPRSAGEASACTAAPISLSKRARRRASLRVRKRQKVWQSG